jgi:Domain of unknown function (DUF4386)
MERIADAGPSPGARAIGAVYLFYFVVALLAPLLTKGLVVAGDAAVTANNILAHESLYRSGIAVGLIGNVCYIALTALFYGLFAPVNRSLSLFAAFVSLVGCGIQIFGGLFQLAPLVVLKNSHGFSAFTVEQLQAMALLSFKLYSQTFNISLVLFGFYELAIGYLIFRSTFLPRFIGVWFMVAGLGWLIFLWPPLATALFPYILIANLAEAVLMLWLLVKGVNVDRWSEQSR